MHLVEGSLDCRVQGLQWSCVRILRLQGPNQDLKTVQLSLLSKKCYTLFAQPSDEFTGPGPGTRNGKEGLLVQLDITQVRVWSPDHPRTPEKYPTSI
jgi:hypothetical protein